MIKVIKRNKKLRVSNYLRLVHNENANHSSVVVKSFSNNDAILSYATTNGLLTPETADLILSNNTTKNQEA